MSNFFSCFLFICHYLSFYSRRICILLTSYSPTFFRHSVWRQFCLYIFLSISQSRQLSVSVSICLFSGILRYFLSFCLRAYMYMLQVCIWISINLSISLYSILAAGESVNRWVIHPLSWYFSVAYDYCCKIWNVSKFSRFFLFFIWWHWNRGDHPQGSMLGSALLSSQNFSN
jgi:hypothetical protein